MKTGELKDRALDWAVAKSMGQENCWMHDYKIGYPVSISTDWSKAGPIIERIKGFQFKQWLESHPESCCEAHIHNYEGDWIQFGPTPLIAAMRCYVASKLGDEVEVPEELQ